MLVGSSGKVSEVQLSGGVQPIRELTWDEGRMVKGEDAVAILIAAGTDTPLASVKEWLQVAGASDVVKLTNAINAISGFGEGAQKSD